jgi:hypothetical protein
LLLAQVGPLQPLLSQLQTAEVLRLREIQQLAAALVETILMGKLQGQAAAPAVGNQTVKAPLGLERPVKDLLVELEHKQQVALLAPGAAAAARARLVATE